MTQFQQDFLRNLNGLINEMARAAVSNHVDVMVEDAIKIKVEDKYSQLKRDLNYVIHSELERNNSRLPEGLRIQIQDLIQDTLSKTTFTSTTPTKI